MRYVGTFEDAPSGRSVTSVAWTSEYRGGWLVPLEVTIGRLPRGAWHPVEEDRLVICYRDAPDPEPQLIAAGERFDPLEGMDALNDFLRLDLDDDDAIVAYYAKYGVLGFPSTHGPPFHPGFADTRGTPPDAEYAEEWGDRWRLRGEPVWWLREQQEELATLMELAAGMASEDYTRLRKMLGPGPKGGHYAGFRMRRGNRFLDVVKPVAEALPCPPTRSKHPLIAPLFVRRSGPTPPRARPLRDEECREIAQDILKSIVNMRMVNVQRMVVVPREPGARTAWRLIGSWGYGTLLDAMYIHVSSIVTGEARLRRCKACHSLFGIPLITTGRPKQYCDYRCRWKANKRAQPE